MSVSFIKRGTVDAAAFESLGNAYQHTFERMGKSFIRNMSADTFYNNDTSTYTFDDLAEEYGLKKKDLIVSQYTQSHLEVDYKTFKDLYSKKFEQTGLGKKLKGADYTKAFQEFQKAKEVFAKTLQPQMRKQRAELTAQIAAQEAVVKSFEDSLVSRVKDVTTGRSDKTKAKIVHAAQYKMQRALQIRNEQGLKFRTRIWTLEDFAARLKSAIPFKK